MSKHMVLTENEMFQAHVYEEVRNHLRGDLDANLYAYEVLNQLWNGEGYGEQYFEIPKRDTKDGNPWVISY